MKSRDLAIVAFAVVLVAFSAPTVAQDYYITEDGVTVSLSPDVVEPGESPINTPSGGPDTYGISDFVIYNIAGVEFDPQHDSQYGHFSNGAIHESGTSSAKWFHASFHLPEGALLFGTTPFYYDSSVTEDVIINVYQCAGAPGDGCTLLDTRTTSGSGGWQAGYNDLDVGHHTIDNWDNSAGNLSYYRVYLTLSSATSSDQSLRMKGVTLWYMLQISPAPLTATFPDVAPGFWAFQYVEALAASGITTGFPDGTFRPAENVTRAQMATFLARALGLHWEF